MKCTKVKNPCKICFQPVSKKNGLRCQGACQKWAHYKCLNYTPGKIHDIKAGIIVITCPCPDCATSEAKEVLKDPPYTCTNTQCPANKLPICASTECPSKNASPIPTYPPPPVEYSPAPSPVKHSPAPSPVKQQCTSDIPSKKPNKCNMTTSSSGLMLKKQGRPTQCKSTCLPKQSQSCSNLSTNSFDSDIQHLEQMRTFSSESHLSNVDQEMLVSALENLSNTVGQLSTQLRDIVCKIKEVAVR